MNDQAKLSRRTMLSAGAATLGAMAMSTSLLRAETASKPEESPGAGAAPRSDARLRWGVIGTGTRGGFTHVPVLKEAPESQTVGLCDISEDRLQAAAKRVGHPVQTYSDYQKLLANPDINAVVIAVPNLLHREVLQAALQAGKHVYCEKPAGIGIAEGIAIKQMVDAAKTVVMFGMQYRHFPRMQQIADLIAAGKIGKPKYIVMNSSRGDWNLNPNVWRYSDPKVKDGKPVNWRFSHAATGGTLNEYSCHYFDLMHWYAGGIPQRVSGDGGISVYKDGRDTWDHASVTMHYPDDVVAVHTFSLFGPSRADFSIFGTEGAIETEAKEGLRLTIFGKKGTKGGNKTQEIAPDETPQPHSADRPTLALYKDFLACVKTGKRPDASVDRALAACRTCWLAELSANRKAEVKWDESTAG